MTGMILIGSRTCPACGVRKTGSTLQLVAWMREHRAKCLWVPAQRRQ